MAAARNRAAAPKIGLRIEDAADALSVSPNHFRTHVLPHLRVCFIGKALVVPVAELEKWVEANGVRAGDQG